MAKKMRKHMGLKHMKKVRTGKNMGASMQVKKMVKKGRV